MNKSIVKFVGGLTGVGGGGGVIWVGKLRFTMENPVFLGGGGFWAHYGGGGFWAHRS